MNVIETVKFVLIFFSFWFQTQISFSGTVLSFLKGRHTPLSKNQKCIGHEKRNRLQVSKVEFIFQISPRNKIFNYSSSFLKLCKLNQISAN